MLADVNNCLPELEKLDLRYNKRLSAFSLKYLFANLINRLIICPNFEIELITQNDIDELKKNN